MKLKHRKKFKNICQNFSDDIHIEFVLENCPKIALKRGQLVHSQNLMLVFNREIQDLEQGKTYMYLGTEESEDIHQQIKKNCRRIIPGD